MIARTILPARPALAPPRIATFARAPGAVLDGHRRIAGSDSDRSVAAGRTGQDRGRADRHATARLYFAALEAGVDLSGWNADWTAARLAVADPDQSERRRA